MVSELEFRKSRLQDGVSSTTFGWQMGVPLRGVLRCVSRKCGPQFAWRAGTTLIQEFCAVSWGTGAKVLRSKWVVYHITRPLLGKSFWCKSFFRRGTLTLWGLKSVQVLYTKFTLATEMTFLISPCTVTVCVCVCAAHVGV